MARKLFIFVYFILFSVFPSSTPDSSLFPNRQKPVNLERIFRRIFSLPFLFLPTFESKPEPAMESRIEQRESRSRIRKRICRKEETTLGHRAASTARRGVALSTEGRRSTFCGGSHLQRNCQKVWNSPLHGFRMGQGWRTGTMIDLTNLIIKILEVFGLLEWVGGEKKERMNVCVCVCV